MSRARDTRARLATAAGLAWRAHPGALAGYLAGSLLAGVVPVATAWLTKLALDRVVATRSEAGASSGAAAAWAFGLALALVGFGVAVLPPLLRFLQSDLGRRVSVLAKDELYRRVTGVPLLGALEEPAFRDRLRLAEQASRSGPVELVTAVVGTAQAAVTLTGLAGALLVIQPWVAVALLAAAVPAVLAELRLSRRRAELMWRMSPVERREFFYTELLTSLGAAKEIRLFGTGALFRRRMLEELSASNAAERRFERREAGTEIALAGLAAALAGGALIWVLLDAAAGRATIGDVAAVVVAVGGVQSALTGAVQNIGVAHHAGLLLDHYRAVTAAPAERPPTAGSPKPSPGTGIELADVWFRYGEGRPWVLRGVSVTIPPGQAVAVVGENGSGKSTLVKLLCRFYDPTRGSIRWDGVDLRDLPLDELHRRIGAVFQDFVEYELSARENVALGATDGRDVLDVDPDRLADAARRADVHDAVERLPAGYRTMLSRVFAEVGDGLDEGSDGGVLLSGGQWQRLAVARALYRGPRELLVLDEPSSGLDAEAEHRIHTEIRRHRRGRTSVLVSHRLSTVRDADRIVVLDAGEVTEQGDHDELLAADGTYARLFRLQAAGYGATPAP